MCPVSVMPSRLCRGEPGWLELPSCEEECRKTKAIAKQAGIAVSLSEPAEDTKCLAGIFFGGAEGKAVQVPCRPGWAERIAAAQIRLCARTICTVVCI